MRARRFLISLLSILTVIAFGLTGIQTAQAVKPGGGGGGGGGGGSTSGGIGVKIQGYDKVSLSWTPGNTAGYAELEEPGIPFRLILTGPGKISSLQLLADAERSGVPGFDHLDRFDFCASAPTATSEKPAVPGAPPVAVVDPSKCGANLGGAYVTHDPDRSASGVRQLVYTLHDVDIPAGGLVVRWFGVLALDSHLYPGSALHMQIGEATAMDGSAISFGSKDVPIPVNGILATETDKLVEGQDSWPNAVVGDVLDFTVTGKAIGPTKGSQQLTIRDELPGCLDYEEGSGVPAPNSPTPAGVGGVLTWGPFTVKNGGTKTVSFRAEVVTVGTCENVAFTHSNVVPNDSKDSVLITAKGIPNLAPDKECDASVAPGGTADCTITVKNIGSETSAAGTVTDDLEKGLTFVAGTPTPTSVSGSAATGTHVVWALPALAPGAEFVITYGETVPAIGPHGTQEFEDTATTHSAGDGSPGDDSDTEIVTVTYVADTYVDKTCPASAPAGGQATYTIAFGNLGNGDATGVVITDTLPAGMTFDSSSLTPTSVANGKVTWTIGGLAAKTDGTSITMTLDVNGSGPFTNKVDIVATQTETSTTNNHDECTTGLDYTDVGILKDCGASSAQPGATLVHTLTFGNSGNQPAANVTITDTLDAGLTQTGTPTYQLDAGVPTPTFSKSSNGRVLTWTFSSLPAGKGGTISYSVGIADQAPTAGEQTLRDEAVIATTSGNALNPGNDRSACATKVDYQPRLTLSKNACPEIVVSGGLLTYTITYRNDGHAPATGVKIVDTPSANQPIQSAPGATISNNTATWTIGTLAVGPAATKTLVVEADATDGTVLGNTAVLTADQLAQQLVAVSQPVTVTQDGEEAEASAHALQLKLGAVEIIPTTTSDSTAYAAAGDPAADDTSGFVLPSPVSTLLAPVLSGGLLVTTSHAESGTGLAQSMSTATVADLNLLGGLITSETVRGVSQSNAGPFGAESSTLGSTFEELVISGEPGTIDGDVPPGTKVDLTNVAGQVIGYVVLNDATTTATVKDGLWTTTSSNDMIHVFVYPSLIHPAGVEVVVGHTESSASYPVGLACGVVPNTVSGLAYTAHVQPAGLADIWVNRAEIDAYGGTADKDAANASVPSVLTAGAVTNDATGSIGNPPTASARSTAADVNLLAGVIKATLVDMKAASSADGTTADTVFTANFVNLLIQGMPFGGSPPPNTVIDIPPTGCTPITSCRLIHIVLNEQTEITPDGKNTEGTVNAIHVRLFEATGVLTTDIVVVSAHSDAHKGG